MNRRQPVLVLLLDHRDDRRRLSAGALRRAGWTVEEAASENSARTALAGAQPTIIAMAFDRDTRDDRLNFCRTLKADAALRHVPILLLTGATATADDVELATDPGVLVLTIPADDQTKLVAAVQGVIAARRPRPLRASLDERRKKRGG